MWTKTCRRFNTGGSHEDIHLNMSIAMKSKLKEQKDWEFQLHEELPKKGTQYWNS